MVTRLDGHKARHPETLRRIRFISNECLQLNAGEEVLSGMNRLSDLVGLDSMAAVLFVAAIEKEFQIVIEPEFLNLQFLDNLPGLARYVESRRKNDC